MMIYSDSITYQTTDRLLPKSALIMLIDWVRFTF